MSHRPYPRTNRARSQIERAAHLPLFPECEHPVQSHVVEDGRRVCVHGDGARVTCRDCAELWARMPTAAAFRAFARALARPTSRAASLSLHLGSGV